MKYTIDDLINGDIIVSCNYTQAKYIASRLRSKNIDVSCIDNTIVFGSVIFYIYVRNSELIIIDSKKIGTFEDKNKIVGFNELDVDFTDLQDDHETESKKFKLNEVVHAIIPNLETFNPFAKTENVTAIISAIDRKNEMCEIVYLHQKHKTLWVRNENIFHIEHTYDEVAIDECFEDIEQ